MNLKKGFALALFAFCFVALFGNVTSVSAAFPDDIVDPGALIDSNVATVVDENTEISSKYKFYPEFIKGVTTVEPFGPANWEVKWSPSEYQDFLAFIPTSDSQKGEVGVIYRKVGMYNGRWIDLKITVENWDSFAYRNGNIAYSTTNIRHATQSYKSVTQTWEFIDHETGESVPLDGYLTLADIDVRQGVRLTDSQMNALDGLYVTNDRWLKYEYSNGMHSIFDSTNSNVYPGGLPTDNSLYPQFPYNHDKFTNMTVTFSNTSSITFDWTRAYVGRWDDPNKDPDFNQISGAQVFFTTGKKLARTEPLKPEKYISVDGELLEENTLPSYKQGFTYEIVHQVHDEYAENYYQKYEIKDVVPKGLNIKSVDIRDEEGNDVSHLFDNESSGNTVLFKAKPSTLNSKSFYGKTYKVKIEVVPADLDTLNKLAENDIVEWVNKAEITVNNSVKTSNEVSTKLHRRNIDVWHIDKIDNTTLEHTTDKKFDGEDYSYSTKDTFRKEDWTYTPVPKETKNGTVSGENIEIKFYYRLPYLDVNMKHIQIYTASSEEGLPVKLDITRSFPYGTEIPEVSSKKVKIELFKKDSNQALISKEFALKDVPEHIDDWKIPKEGLEKGKHNNYVVKISGIDNIDVVSSNPQIDTDGYTSSEKNIKVNAGEDKALQYKDVIMTEREVNKEMEKHYETLTIPLKKLPKQKTGYGFELKTDITYTNDLLGTYDIKTEAIVDNALIDSYLDYEQKDGNSVITLDNTKKTISSDKKSTDFVFELPHVNVEEKTGALFTDKQVTDGDSRIQYEMKDGKRKLYAPIWADLGNYNIYVKSTEPIGVNKVKFQIAHTLNLYAYMYGTMGSETLEHDELVIEPVDPKNPFSNDIPPGWSEEDIAWLKK